MSVVVQPSYDINTEPKPTEKFYTEADMIYTEMGELFICKDDDRKTVAVWAAGTWRNAEVVS